MIDNLLPDPYTIDWKDADAVINYYESNKAHFDDYTDIKHDQLIEDYINFKLHYINALISKNRFVESKEYLVHVDILNQKIKHLEEKYEKYEEEKDYYLALTYAYLKDPNNAVDIFKRLSRLHPNNENYLTWYKHSRLYILSKQFNILGYIGVSVVIFDFIAGYFYNFNLDIGIVIGGYMLGIIAWGFHHYINYQRRKNRN